VNNKRRTVLAKLQNQLSEIDTEEGDYKVIKKAVDEIKDKIAEVHTEEQKAHDNLLPSLQDSDKGEAMVEALDAMQSAIDDLDSIKDINPSNEPGWRDSVEEGIDDAMGHLEEAQA
jgi:hypothetical protein